MRRWARLRERLRTRGLRLMLDFVPDHAGLDRKDLASQGLYLDMRPWSYHVF